MENPINNVNNFISSKYSDETRNMHKKSYNIEIMMGSETDNIIDELCEPLLKKYQEGLKESMRRKEFIFYSVDFLYYNQQSISLNIIYRSLYIHHYI